jgi:hypothetical protein
MILVVDYDDEDKDIALTVMSSLEMEISHTKKLE